MGKCRRRSIKPSSGQLIAYHDNKQDIVYAWGGDGAASADGRCLCQAIESIPILDGKPLAKLLKERGYDLTTLRFSINRRNGENAEQTTDMRQASHPPAPGQQD